MTFSDDQKKMLAAKLNPDAVKPPAPGKYGSYIEGWHSIAEANRIFGFDGWSYRVTRLEVTNAGEVNGKHQIGYLCSVLVTVENVEREDFGHGAGDSKNLGNAHDSAIKEAVTDALKRALKSFGNPFGLALYDKSGANVGVDEEALAEEHAKVAYAKCEAWAKNLTAEIAKADRTALATLSNKHAKAMESAEKRYPAIYAPLNEALSDRWTALDAHQAPPNGKAALAPPELVNGEAH